MPDRRSDLDRDLDRDSGRDLSDEAAQFLADDPNPDPAPVPSPAPAADPVPAPVPGPPPAIFDSESRGTALPTGPPTTPRVISFDDDPAPSSGSDRAAGRAPSATVPAARPGKDARTQDRGLGLGMKMAAIALAVLVGLAGGTVALGWMFGKSLSALNPFQEKTIDRSGAPVLKSLNDLKSYHAASGYYEVVVDQERDVTNLPSFLAGERTIFVAAGSVDATVDFAGIESGNVTTNADRTEISIELPAVSLAAPALDLNRSYVADRQRGLKERLQEALGSGAGTSQDTAALYRLAQQRLATAATQSDDLRKRAEENTRAMLTALLSQAGFTSITVTFATE